MKSNAIKFKAAIAKAIKNKNAYIHHCQNGRVFVSYTTPIVVYLDNARMPSLRRDCYEFS